MRLELPDGETGRTAAPEADSPTLDPVRLARAVEDLIRAIDPGLAGARVEVEVTRPVPVVVPTRTATALPATGGRPVLGLDRAGRTLSVDGQVVTLTRREFDLLAYLQDHRGVALSREELMNTVWRSGYLVGDRTIDVHVRRLRVKLGRHAHRLSTLRGYGYRLD